jgi:hypothetical protein
MDLPQSPGGGIPGEAFGRGADGDRVAAASGGLTMTAVGKILVFVNLLFSLVVAGLLIMFHVAQTNWKDAAKKWQERHDIVAAEGETYKIELAQLHNQMDKEVADLKGKLDAEQKTAQAQKKRGDDLDQDLKVEKSRYDKNYVPPLQASAKEIERASDATSDMSKRVQAGQERINNLLKENVDLRAARTAAEIEARSSNRRAQEMEEKIQEMAKELVKAKSPTGSTSPGSRLSAKNPPPENVEGLVTRTDPASGLVVLSIGSDAGLLRGHTLEVFRLNPNKYLGTIQIMDVRPNEAVGKPMTKMLGPIQQGDRVAAKILGN